MRRIAPGSASARSPARSPASPRTSAARSPASPWRYTAALSTSAGATPCARSPPAMPVSTSPVPPVAIPGLPVGFRSPGRRDRHHRPCSLQRDVGAALGRQAPRARDPVGLDLGDPAAEEPRRLARMRRQEPWRRSLAAERQTGRRARSGRQRPRPWADRRHAPVSGRRPASPDRGLPRGQGHASMRDRSSTIRSTAFGTASARRSPAKAPSSARGRCARHHGLLGRRRRARHEARAGPRAPRQASTAAPVLPTEPATTRRCP